MSWLLSWESKWLQPIFFFTGATLSTINILLWNSQIIFLYYILNVTRPYPVLLRDCTTRTGKHPHPHPHASQGSTMPHTTYSTCATSLFHLHAFINFMQTGNIWQSNPWIDVSLYVKKNWAKFRNSHSHEYFVQTSHYCHKEVRWGRNEWGTFFHFVDTLFVCYDSKALATQIKVKFYFEMQINITTIMIITVTIIKQ